MIVAVDACSLAFLVNPASQPPIEPETGQPVSFAAERVRYLITRLSKSHGLIIIPTPALAEVLVQAADGGAEFVNQVNNSSALEVVPFDQMAALELAAITRESIGKGDKKGGVQTPWQKVKFDRQICAIAKVHRAEQIYTDDLNLAAFAREVGIEPVTTGDLPLPPEPEPDLLASL